MTEQAVRHAAAALLKHYSFDLGGYTTDQLVQHWLDHYPALWLRMAIVEALYQGRYKAVSVDQILTLWHRRSQPVCHYNHEFERMICNRFPRNLLNEEENQGLLMLADVFGAERQSAPAGLTLGTDTEQSAPAAASASAEPQRATPEREGASSTDAIAPEAAAPESRANASAQATFEPSEPSALAHAATSLEPMSRDEAVRQPIHQFVPSGETPEFYTRMRASSVSEDDFFKASDTISSFN